MRQKKFHKRIRNRFKKRGWGLPYVYGAISRTLGCIVETVGDVIGIDWLKRKTFGLSIKRNLKEKKENIKHKKIKFLGTDLKCCILLVNSSAII